MTLFTLLLVTLWERLFKMGEHWQLDHRLEVVFRRVKHFSMLRTILMTALCMLVVFLCVRALQGLFFNIPLLVFWIALGVLCIGAGQVRLHYHAYLQAASHDDLHARDAMASELTLIHGVPPDCDEREYLKELQNALLWINFRFYLAPIFWFIVGGLWGAGHACGIRFPARLADLACPTPYAASAPAFRHRCHFARAGLGAGTPGRRGLRPARAWRESAAGMVCFPCRSPYLAVPGADPACAVFAGARAAS